jgi:hypothetical protein
MTDGFGPLGSWKKLRAVQQRRAPKALLRLETGRLREDPFAAQFWSRRTWSEFAAVPSMAQLVLALVREGAPFEVQGAFLAIAADESRHAELSRALAERLGGYENDPASARGYDPTSLADPSEVAVAVWAVANGCFSETVSLALIHARARATPPGPVKDVLDETARDEAVHVAAGWELAEAVLPRLAQADRRAMYDYGQTLAQMLRRTFGTEGLPEAERRAERRLRSRTYALGLGALPPDEEDARVDAALVKIFERLERLGVRAPRSAPRADPA